MIALSDGTVGWVLLVGVICITMASYLPSRRIRNFHLTGRTAFRLVGVFILFGIVFFTWMQSHKRDIEKVAQGAADVAEQADDLGVSNQERIEDIERVREDAIYTTCVDRNETRQRVRGEYGSIIAQEESNLERMMESPELDLTVLPGFSDLADPAAVELWTSIADLLLLNRGEAVRLQEVEVEAAKAALNRYIQDEPFEQCGNDPIPNADPVRPPITAAFPLESVPPLTPILSATVTETTM